MKLHGHFVDKLFVEQHFRRSRVGRSFDGCEDANPDVLDGILRHNECSDLLETHVCDIVKDENLCVEHDVNFVMHRESKKPNHGISQKPIRLSEFTQQRYHRVMQIHRVVQRC